MSSHQDLAGQVRDLEQRLHLYHHQLEQALEHDRKFQLEASSRIWGAILGCGGFFVVAYVTNHWLHMTGWISGMLAGFAALFALGAGYVLVDKERERDARQLSKLPKWRADG